MFEWASYKWFLPETLQKFTWAQPLYLYGLLSIPFFILIRWISISKNGQKLKLTLSRKWEYSAWYQGFRFLVPLFFVLGLMAAILALARPQLPQNIRDENSKGINIVLTLDISESMANKDIAPNRLEAAKQVAIRFLAARRHDKFGLVIFAGEGYSICPLTSDYALLRKYISNISFEANAGSGTAIGEAIATAINRLRDAEGSSKAIILISDGDNTAGRIGPETALQLAKSFRTRVYSIGIGRNLDDQTNFSMLRKIALESGGALYPAGSGQDLAQVFSKIGMLEREHFIRSGERDIQDFYPIYLNWAVGFILLSFFIKNTPLGNVLED